MGRKTLLFESLNPSVKHISHDSGYLGGLGSQDGEVVGYRSRFRGLGFRVEGLGIRVQGLALYDLYEPWTTVVQVPWPKELPISF